MYDVAVIGAGVVGGMIARRLSAYKMKICVLEAESDVAMGATKANSAIVHAGFDAKVGSLKARLNVRGSEMMERVTAELGVKYRKNGSLVIGFTEEDEATLSELLERGRKNGVKDLRIIRGEELFSLEPNLSREIRCALHAPTGAIVCPYELALAAIGNAMDNGVELKCGFKVSKIAHGSDAFTISSEKESISARVVINAAGLYSDEVSRLLGEERYTVTPRRGEYILLDKECGSMLTHTVFRTPSKMGKGILVTPTVDGNLLCGPTSVDIDDKGDKATTAEGFAKIIALAKEDLPGIPFGKTISSFTGLRAVGNTGDFIIDASHKGIVNLCGIESPGLTAAPAIAEYVEELLREGGELTFNKKEGYDPIRKPAHSFREASLEEKQKIIEKDRSYGRIICRCEGVSEGEILEAIRTNPKPRDLDGVKRRTRAQMGRCQGGFCSPYIVELLARELSVGIEDITKSGGESRIIFGRTKEDTL